MVDVGAARETGAACKPRAAAAVGKVPAVTLQQTASSQEPFAQGRVSSARRVFWGPVQSE